VISGPQVNLSLEHIDDALAQDVITRILDEGGLAQALASHFLALAPDPSTWRLTLTGDMVKSVNAIRGLSGESSYTVERGSGQAAGRTMKREDGTFDIVLSDVLFHADLQTGETVEDRLQWIGRMYAHLAAHEAGHVALGQRGEDVDVFVPLISSLPPNQLIWQNVVGVCVEELRCDQYANRVAPVGTTQADGFQDAISHFRNELEEASASWGADIHAAYAKTMGAVSVFLRVLTLVAAETGTDADGQPIKPDSLFVGWNEYVEPIWNEWSSTLHRLGPADIPMSSSAEAEVGCALCRCIPGWLATIGIGHEIDPVRGESMYWTKTRY